MGEEMLRGAVAALTSESLWNFRGRRSRGGMFSRSVVSNSGLTPMRKAVLSGRARYRGRPLLVRTMGMGRRGCSSSDLQRPTGGAKPHVAPLVHPPRPTPNILPPIAQPCKVSAVRFQRAYRILGDEPFFVVSDRTGDDCAPPVANAAFSKRVVGFDVGAMDQVDAAVRQRPMLNRHRHDLPDADSFRRKCGCQLTTGSAPKLT